MGKLHICPNRNCGSERCPHVAAHKKESSCSRACFRNEKCIEFFRAITAKVTAKSTREYMRNK